MSINKATLIGNVGKDPEVKFLDGGNTVANFPLATTDSYKNKTGEKIDSTEWHNIVVWGKLAEIVDKYVKKGSKLYLEGKIKTRKWEDKEGQNRYSTEIVLEQYGGVMEMLGGKPSENSAASAPEPNNKNTFASDSGADSGDDLPF